MSKRSLMPVSWTCSRIKKSNWSICKKVCKKGRTTFQRRISLATKPPFATTSAKRLVLGLVHRNKMRPSRPRMQQLAKPKPKSATSSAKQRLKFAITRQLSQLLKQVLPWPVQNLAYSLYQFYKSQGEENPQAKAQAVAQVEAQLSQLESILLLTVFSMQVQVPSKPMRLV